MIYYLFSKMWKLQTAKMEMFIMEQEEQLEYFENYKDGACCKGHVYNCEGDICQEISECYQLGLQAHKKYNEEGIFIARLLQKLEAES